MNYYLDTEFHEYFVKPMFGKAHHTVSLISIGIACEDGRKYYAIAKDFDLKAAWKNVWLRENVLSKVFNEILGKLNSGEKYSHPGLGLYHSFSYYNLKYFLKRYGKTNKEIAREVQEFCKTPMSLCVSGQNTPVFHGYYSDYDWVVFCSLFGQMINLPKHFPKYCVDLKQMLDEAVLLTVPSASYEFKSALETVKKHENYPKNADEHSAMADAIWNRNLHQFIKTLK